MTTSTLPPSSPAPVPASSASWSDARTELEADWALWLVGLFEPYIVAPFASHHVEFWDWLWSIRSGVRPHPFVAVWPRGGAKSTSAELACAALGARRIRRYGLYVSETQDQADDHVGSVASLFESRTVEQFYPDLGERKVGKFGNSRGWRRNRIRTAAGFTVDAIGLDSAARGVKLEDARPDFMVLDDLDGELDSAETTTKKIKTLTRKIIPAGSNDLAVLAIQNLVTPDSIFSRLVDGRADFLADRIVSGPIPALHDMAVELVDNRWIITAGTPTWQGQDLARCQEQVDDYGLTAFRIEAQHEVADDENALWRRDWFDEPGFRTAAPRRGIVDRIVVALDPAGGRNDGDEQAISVACHGLDRHYYVIHSEGRRIDVLESIKRAFRLCDHYAADVLVYEKNYGDAYLRKAIDQVAAGWHRPIAHKAIDASQGKRTRAEPIAALYERRLVHHVGLHDRLESQMLRWTGAPGEKSPDRLDATVYALTELAKAEGANVATSNGTNGRPATETADLLTANF